MGFWFRVVVTAAATAAAGAAAWLGLEQAGAGQPDGATVAAIAASVVVTLGAVWASRACGDTDPEPDGRRNPAVVGVGVPVSGSVSAQAVGAAHAPVFGSGSDFTNATILIGGAERSSARPDGQAAAAGTPSAWTGGQVVVGEIPQEPVAFHFGFRNGTKELESGIQLCGRYKCEAKLLAVG